MKVLISGGSGLIGSAISEKLLSEGHEVAVLSRSSKSPKQGIKAFVWDPAKSHLDEAALEGVEAIINLAGSTIAQPWTPHNKELILSSRIDSTRTLVEALSRQENQVHTFINASAVGYYPNSFEQEFTEADPPGSDFLSIVCQKWEQEASAIENLSMRLLRMRIGIVLDNEEGALAKMALPIKFGLGSPLGSGKQWMPWIHKDDLASLFIYALEHSEIPTGVYNAVGPYSVRNEELTKALAKQLHRPLFLPKVPAFVLKLILGEMAATALASNKVSSARIQSYGFKYQYNRLEDALAALYPN